jgi:hypothetical protein
MTINGTQSQVYAKGTISQNVINTAVFYSRLPLLIVLM